MKKILLALVVIITSCTEKKKLSEDSSKETNMQSTSTEKIQTVKPADLKTGAKFSTPVISNAQKFIIPVPAFKEKGERLVYPKDHEKSGKLILDYEGKPIGDKGIVFFNFKDQSLQAAPGDGEGVIIINEVTEEQALKLEQAIEKIKLDPNKLSLQELKQVIKYAHNELELSDMYNSTRSFVEKKMTSVLPKEITKTEKTDPVYGFKKRDDRDINQAIYIPGEFIFEGPAATPQKFKDGGVIIEQDGKMRGVQPDIFRRTYRLADGSEILSPEKDIKTQLN